MSLSAYQDAFAQALFLDPEDADPLVAHLAAQPAFAVYRNTVMKGCIDALESNFPSVARLVGVEWFREAARRYVTSQLPREPWLLTYGASFPAFLSQYAAASQLPWLDHVAQLDRLWTCVHTAPDAHALASSALAIDSRALGQARLQPHPAARWAWFGDAPIYTIWRRNREQDADESEIAWHGEGALLTRPAGSVQWIALEESACRFLNACGLGLTVLQAMEAALEVDPHVDPAAMVSSLIRAGAFSRLTTPTEVDP
jgi:hypothetical protein